MVVLMGKSSINGPFSMAMLDNQRVVIYDVLRCGCYAQGLCPLLAAVGFHLVSLTEIAAPDFSAKVEIQSESNAFEVCLLCYVMLRSGTMRIVKTV